MKSARIARALFLFQFFIDFVVFNLQTVVFCHDKKSLGDKIVAEQATEQLVCVGLLQYTPANDPTPYSLPFLAAPPTNLD